MKTSHIAVAVVALVIVAYLFTSMPKAPDKTVSTAATSNAGFFGLANSLVGMFTGGSKVAPPGSSPSLDASKAAADRAVADGRAVSQTQGNGLMIPEGLDGSSLVANDSSNDVRYV